MGWRYGSGFGLSSLPVPTRSAFGVEHALQRALGSI
jgi:hypothetical protein